MAVIKQPQSRPLKLGQQSNPGRYPALGSARLVNCFAERAGKGSKVEWPLLASIGLTLTHTFSSGGCRGLFAVSDDIAIAVYGTDIIELDRFGTWTAVGGIPGTGPCFFARNRSSPVEAAIVSGGVERVYANGAVVDLNDADLPASIGCDAISGYILFFIADGRFFWSAINDATNIAALDFAEATGRPDGLVRGIFLEKNLWLFGTESTEIWGLTESAEAPFAPLAGAFVEQGAVAPAAVTKVRTPAGVRLCWVAQDRTVRVSSSYTGERISNHAVDRALGNLTAGELALVEAFSYSSDGHIFLVINAPTFTWEFNFTTQLWNEGASYGSTRRTWAYSMEFGGIQYVGDATRPRLYKLDPDANDENGDPLVCKIVTPPDHDFPNDVEYNALYIDAIPGTGITGGAGAASDPAIAVRWSWDVGRTFGNVRLLKTGAAGKYRKRVTTTRLGTSGEDGGVFEIQWSAAVARAITEASVDSNVVRA